MLEKLYMCILSLCAVSSPPALIIVWSERAVFPLTRYSLVNLFQVVNSQRTGSGGGLATEGESIEVLHLDDKETKEMLDNETIDKPLGLIYAIQWRQMKLAGLL